jgi:hypothetical protein
VAPPTQIEEDAQRVLGLLVPLRDHADALDVDQITEWLTGPDIAEELGLPPPRVNDAVSFLEIYGYAETIKAFGTSPFAFLQVRSTPLGRLEYQRSALAPKLEAVRADEPLATVQAVLAPLARSPTPVGSPYGFTEEDWEYVESERDRPDLLKVVVGLQFNSRHFERPRLMKMLRRDFQAAINEYNREPGNHPVRLSVRGLRAGYGEHLFNEIARDVISADIAVFETSDKNSNVMIEMGVALTWGKRVLPIKKKGRPKPPSDISGQTWADYDAQTYSFIDENHHENLLAMVRRVLRRKGSTS